MCYPNQTSASLLTGDDRLKLACTKLPTDLSPLIELFQQIFVQVRGANSSDLLASNQSLQLLPGWLKVGQTLAVAV